MQLILILLAVTIGLVALLRPKKNHPSNEGESQYKNSENVGLDNIDYAYESSEELTPPTKEKSHSSTIISDIEIKDEVEVEKEDKHRYLISNYWRIRERDNEIARIPTSNLNIDLSPKVDNWSVGLQKSISLNEIVLMTQSPDHIYAYWNNNSLGFYGNKKVIRVHRQSDLKDIENYFFEIEIEDGENDKYIKVPESDYRYYAEVGIITENLIFIPIARSNKVKVPRANPSENSSELWMKVSERRREYIIHTANSSLDYNCADEGSEIISSPSSFNNN